MRISDWSSDVCSSDLRAARPPICDCRPAGLYWLDGVGSVTLARAGLLAAALAVAIACPSAAVPAEGGGGGVVPLIAIDGPIGPATSRYVENALATAVERGAELVILRLNTPGGLATSMREIIVDLLASPMQIGRAHV